jgi:hypothetical protein
VSFIPFLNSFSTDFFKDLSNTFECFYDTILEINWLQIFNRSSKVNRDFSLVDEKSGVKYYPSCVFFFTFFYNLLYRTGEVSGMSKMYRTLADNPRYYLIITVVF